MPLFFHRMIKSTLQRALIKIALINCNQKQKNVFFAFGFYASVKNKKCAPTKFVRHGICGAQQLLGQRLRAYTNVLLLHFVSMLREVPFLVL